MTKTYAWVQGAYQTLKREKLAQKKIEYSDIYEDTLKQKNVTALFSELLKVKNEVMESYHPSTSSHEVLKISYNVLEASWRVNIKKNLPKFF